MKRRTTFNRAICAILTGVLIAELFACIASTLVKNTICSKKYIETELEKADYYQITKSEIEDTFKYYVLQSNLDDSCVENLITTEKVKKDTLIELNRYYENSKEQTEIDSIKQELTNRIYNKVEKEYNNIATEKERKDIEELVNIIVKNYTDNMNTIGIGFEAMHTISKKLDKIEEKHVQTIYIVTLATMALISVIYIHGTKNKKIILNKYHAIAFMTVGLIIITIIGVMSIAVKIDDIQLFTKGITAVTVDAVKGIKNAIWLTGISLFTAGLGISIMKNVALKKYLR